MKKLLATILFLLFNTSAATATQAEIKLETQPQKTLTQIVLAENQPTQLQIKEIEINKSEILNRSTPDSSSFIKATPKFSIYNAITQAAKDVYNLEIERTDIPSCLLGKQLTHEFESGPLDNVHLWGAVQNNFTETIKENGSDNSKFNVGLINIILDAQLKGKKENLRIMFDPTPRNDHLPILESFIQDLYIETHRIPHHTVLVGNSRPGIGIEGAQSPYTLAFINRSQISRNLSNVRKFGARVRGDYALVDYDIGAYSSDTFFRSFFPGAEFDAWMNIKPLGKTDGRYGKLVTGGGISTGQKHTTDYFLSGAYVGYDYKKFWTKFEYTKANGSNGGSGLTNRRSEGLYVTAAYRLTKKLELLARYDQFDPDKMRNNNNQKEYTLGTNYYLKGQAMKVIFNYIYCQNDNKPDSHRLMVGTQIIL